MSNSQSQVTGEAAKEHGRDAAAKVSQPRVAKASLWTRFESNIPLVIIMFKGSLPMIITLAMYQSTTVARRYTTVGYIMAMIAFFSMAMLPRVKYIEALVFNIIATCIGAALSLLAIWCGIKARQHTAPAGSTAAYNSSQAAVCAIWFFFTQWAAGTVRAKIPLLQNNVYLFSVLTMIAMTYGPRFHATDQGISLVVELLEIFFIAFGVATGVSLLIFPINTRVILFKKQTAYFGALRGFVRKQTAYYRALETSDPLPTPVSDSTEPKDGLSNVSDDAAQKVSFPEREALYAGLSGLVALHTEIFNDTVYAKRELAYGKLNADDLQQLFKGFRAILTPMVGMRTIIESFDRLALENPSGRESIEEKAIERSELRYLWSRVMAAMHDPFTEIAEVIDQGLKHAAVVLEFLPKPKRSNDVEAQEPGDSAFADYMYRKIQAFHARRSEFISTWMKERDALRKATSGIPASASDQQHLYIVLHMEHLIYSIAVAVYEMVLFADIRARDGTMARKRLILPSFRRVSSLLGNTLGGNPDLALDTAGEHADGKERGFKGETVIHSKAKDPQHLPPRNGWERFSNHLRAFPRLMKSRESAFGLSMALAAFSVGILAYLEKTWTFYYQQKLIWTLIVILVSMNVASGESTFKLAARAIGTVVAMVVSFVAWYIVDGKPAIMSYVNLLTHSTRSWPRSLLLSGTTPETKEVAALFASMSTNSHHLTSALTLLSAAVKYGIPLPPYFKAPPTVDFSALWGKLIADIHSEEAGNRKKDDEAVYSAWAVMHIVGDMTNSALGRMVIEVRELVGEVDFENRFKEE